MFMTALAACCERMDGAMRAKWGRLFKSRAIRRLLAAAALAYPAFCLTAGFAPPAQALPSVARQTGQACRTCHTDFPALTPYDRRFKLLADTAGGGQFRTTPFSSEGGRAARAELDKLRGYMKALPQESQAAAHSN